MSEQLRKFVEGIKNNAEMTIYTEREIEQGIITPLLNQLGWYISNTDGIKLQYSVGTDKVDYALVVNSKPRVFIEVKRSGWQFNADEKKQILNYAIYQGVELAVLTNGISWWFYLPNLKGSWDERKFDAIDIDQQNLDEIVFKFSDYLKKGNVESGEAVKKANVVYEQRQKEKVVLETLPKAWNEIMNDPDELLIELLKDTTEKICNFKPDDEQIKQFLNNINAQPVPYTNTIVPSQTAVSKKSDDDYVSKTNRTPREAFRIPILQALLELGGKGETKDVLRKIGIKMQNILTQLDYEKLPSKVMIRWQNTAQWERFVMVQDGLIKPVKESKKGYWVLTDKGLKLAKQSAFQKGG